MILRAKREAVVGTTVVGTVVGRGCDSLDHVYNYISPSLKKVHHKKVPKKLSDVATDRQKFSGPRARAARGANFFTR